MLPKAARLSAREISGILKTGQASVYNTRYARVLISRSAGPSGKIAVSISGKVSPKASTRNRIKRSILGRLEAQKIIWKSDILVFIKNKPDNLDELAEAVAKVIQHN